MHLLLSERTATYFEFPAFMKFVRVALEILLFIGLFLAVMKVFPPGSVLVAGLLYVFLRRVHHWPSKSALLFAAIALGCSVFMTILIVKGF